jgi:hypothetical protein
MTGTYFEGRLPTNPGSRSSLSSRVFRLASNVTDHCPEQQHDIMPATPVQRNEPLLSMGSRCVLCFQQVAQEERAKKKKTSKTIRPAASAAANEHQQRGHLGSKRRSTRQRLYCHNDIHNLSMIFERYVTAGIVDLLRFCKTTDRTIGIHTHITDRARSSVRTPHFVGGSLASPPLPGMLMGTADCASTLSDSSAAAWTRPAGRASFARDPAIMLCPVVQYDRPGSAAPTLTP